MPEAWIEGDALIGAIELFEERLGWARFASEFVMGGAA